MATRNIEPTEDLDRVIEECREARGDANTVEILAACRLAHGGRVPAC